MRGPIDYIIVGFPKPEFDGAVLEELKKSMDQGIIDILDVAVIQRDKDGNVSSVEIANTKEFSKGLISEEDVMEAGELLEDDSAAGLLIIEQLWAKGFKKALLDKNAVLLSEGRIHPEASKELN